MLLLFKKKLHVWQPLPKSMITHEVILPHLEHAHVRCKYKTGVNLVTRLSSSILRLIVALGAHWMVNEDKNSGN